MNRFQFSVRSVLAVILVTCISIVLFQNYMARRDFFDIKTETANKLFAFDWEPAQRQALESTLDQITFENRLQPMIAFASVGKSRVARKLESMGIGTHVLSMGWFDLSRSVESIRFKLTNGRHFDYQLKEEHQYDGLYSHVIVFVGNIGIENGKDIESVTLMANGEIVSEPKPPMFSFEEPNVE